MRDKVPPEVFTTPYANPVAGTSENVRANLREGMRLLREAGYEVRDYKQVHVRTGEVLSVEILGVTSDPLGAERFILFYKPALVRLGIDATVRSVDDVQYENRLRDFDFDIIIATWPQSLSPGNEQRDLWSSQAADTHGSRNYVGIKNPAVDALIERVIFAKSRGELVAAARALDRVLLWNHYVVPQFTDDKVCARHAGTASAGPIRCPSMAARHFQRSGGGMPKGPPNEGSWYRITSATSYVLCLIALLFLPETRGKPLTG